MGSIASPFSSSSPHVSHCPANPRTSWTLPPNPNTLLSSTALADPAYCDWQHGFGRAPSHLPTFASAQAGNQWPPQPGSQSHGTDAQMLNYNQNQYYTLGENSMFSPQTMSGFGSSFAAPGMALKSMPEDDNLNFLHDAPVSFYDSSSSFSSNGASDMLEAMMLKDCNSTQSPWTMPGDHLGAESLPCIVGTAGPSLVEQPLPSPNSWEVPTLVSAPQATVSPKLLRLRPTPTPTSSSESIRTSFLAGNSRDASFSQAVSRSGSQSTSSQTMDIDPASAASKPRKMLPDRAPRPTHRESSRDSESYPSISKSSRRSHRNSSLPSLRQLSKVNAKVKPGSPVSRPLPLLSPAPLKSPRQQSTSTPIFMDPETEERRAKDEFLVESKQKGMTYKQIRLAGGFTEAESTLRGRYRTLTKSREARVRKPEWSTRDVSLVSFIFYTCFPVVVSFPFFLV